MEELRQAASAYYSNGSYELQELATNFFQSMDRNGDGRVERDEFIIFLQQSGYGWINPNFFNDLDRNGDGGLDFMEVLTFYYIMKTRNFWCNVCGLCLTGLYFTCVECFDNVAVTTYDLCPGCYAGRPHAHFYHHQHNYFLDNHMLLRSKRGHGPPNLTMAIASPQPIYNHPPAARPARTRLWQTFHALDAAVNVANLVTLCSIL